MQAHIRTEQYSLALDGRLSPTEQEGMRLHLLACGDCRTVWQVWQDVSGRFTETPMMAAPPGFLERFERRLERHHVRQRTFVGGAVLLTGSIALWGLIALGVLLAGMTWVSMEPGIIGSMVLFAVRVAAFTQPLVRGIRLVRDGMGQLPLQLVSASTGAAILLLTLGWVQLVQWHRRGVVQAHL